MYPGMPKMIISEIEWANSTDVCGMPYAKLLMKYYQHSTEKLLALPYTKLESRQLILTDLWLGSSMHN